MPWDPVNALPQARQTVWLVLAFLVCLVQGPSFVKSLRPSPQVIVDFFQNWAAARYFLQGHALYEDMDFLVHHYLAVHESDRFEVNITKNAHPPFANLVVLPFALLNYSDATLVWNLFSLVAFGVSLWLIARELEIRWVWWSPFPLVTILLVCAPFRHQVHCAQLNGILLLLITLAWVADHANRPWCAGCALGMAVAIKLFPGILFAYFALRQRWKVVLSSVLVFLTTTLLTILVLGFDNTKDYVVEVMPGLGRYYSWWHNASLTGFWLKLFGADGATWFTGWQVEPIRDSPFLVRAGILVSVALLLFLWVREVIRARSQPERDHAFGLTLTTMLLVSPITWDHYYLLLTLPLAQIWLALPRSDLYRTIFLVTLIGLCAPMFLIWQVFIPHPGPEGGSVAAPWQSLLLLSLPNYLLLTVFALGLALRPSRLPAMASEGPSEVAPTLAR